VTKIIPKIPQKKEQTSNAIASLFVFCGVGIRQIVADIGLS